MVGCFIPGHRCVDNEIHTYAGAELRLEMVKKMRSMFKNADDAKMDTAVPLISDAYNLPCKKIIHVAGPNIIDEVTEDDEELLYMTYQNSLELARKNGIKTIAFPCISSELYNFPKEEAARIAIKAVRDFLIEDFDSFDRVIFCVFTDENEKIYREILSK